MTQPETLGVDLRDDTEHFDSSYSSAGYSSPTPIQVRVPLQQSRGTQGPGLVPMHANEKDPWFGNVSGEENVRNSPKPTAKGHLQAHIVSMRRMTSIGDFHLLRPKSNREHRQRGMRMVFDFDRSQTSVSSYSPRKYSLIIFILADMYRGIFKFGVFNAVQTKCYDTVGAPCRNLLLLTLSFVKIMESEENLVCPLYHDSFPLSNNLFRRSSVVSSSKQGRTWPSINNA